MKSTISSLDYAFFHVSPGSPETARAHPLLLRFRRRIIRRGLAEISGKPYSLGY
jgi:hypothetical protein